LRKIVWLLFLSMLLLFSVSLPAWADGTTVGPVVNVADPNNINVDDEFTVDVKVNNVEGLAGVGMDILFDSNVLEVLDANDKKPGIQIMDGNVFDMDYFLPAVNKVINNSIQYSAMVFSGDPENDPAPLFNGTGILCSIKFKAIASGTCNIEFDPNSITNPGGFSLGGSGGALIQAKPFSATVTVPGPTVEKKIEVTLTNDQAVNTQRPLGITASAKEDSQSVSVTWDVKIKNETGTVIKTFPSSVGTTFNETWTPTITEIPADLPITKGYQVEVKATYADNGSVTKTVDFTLSNYDLVIKKVEYAGSKINVTVENLAQETKNNVDCILQISKADGTLVNLEFKPADIAPGEKTIEFSPVSLSAGNYKAEVFLWDLATWQTLSSPKEINFTV